MQTLSERVTETLRDWILHGRIKPGERIEEIPLATQMGASRTPVRAALATLANEGLIDYRPNRGYTVRTFDLDTIAAAYEVRAALEGLACRKAAENGLSEAQIARLHACLALGDRILAKGRLLPEDHAPYQCMNVDLHTCMVEASGNPWVGRFVEDAHNIPFASDRIVLWDLAHQVILRSHGDHHRIVEAVVERDGARAEQLMREHVYYAGVLFNRHFHDLTADSGPSALARLSAGHL